MTDIPRDLVEDLAAFYCASPLDVEEALQALMRNERDPATRFDIQFQPDTIERMSPDAVMADVTRQTEHVRGSATHW